MSMWEDRNPIRYAGPWRAEHSTRSVCRASGFVQVRFWEVPRTKCRRPWHRQTAQKPHF